MSNVWRSTQQTKGAAVALKLVKQFGDVVTYHATSGSYTLYALSPNLMRSTFQADEERIEWLVPVQSGMNTNPSSGSLIQMGSTKWAIESVEPDDGVYPTTFKLECFRWMHDSPEIQ